MDIILTLKIESTFTNKEENEETTRLLTQSMAFECRNLTSKTVCIYKKALKRISFKNINNVTSWSCTWTFNCSFSLSSPPTPHSPPTINVYPLYNSSWEKEKQSWAKERNIRRPLWTLPFSALSFLMCDLIPHMGSENLLFLFATSGSGSKLIHHPSAIVVLPNSATVSSTQSYWLKGMDVVLPGNL